MVLPGDGPLATRPKGRGPDRLQPGAGMDCDAQRLGSERSSAWRAKSLVSRRSRRTPWDRGAGRKQAARVNGGIGTAIAPGRWTRNYDAQADQPAVAGP